MEWLNRAYEQRDEDLYFIAGDPLMRNLEHDHATKNFCAEWTYRLVRAASGVMLGTCGLYNCAGGRV